MKKYLKYLCIAIFLFIGFGINNVEAKELTCNYNYTDVTASTSYEYYAECTFNTGKGTYKCSMNYYKKGKEKTKKSATIKNYSMAIEDFAFTQGNDEKIKRIKATKKCPDYMVGLYNGTSVSLYATSDESIKNKVAEEMYKKNIYYINEELVGSSSDAFIVALKGSHVGIDTSKWETLYQNFAEESKKISDLITDYENNSCTNEDAFITKYSECKKKIGSLETITDAVKKNLQESIVNDGISENDSRIQDLNSNIKASEQLIEKEKKFLENADCEIKLQLGLVSFCPPKSTDQDKVETTCSDLPATTKLLKQIYGLIKYLIPVLVIGLSIVDFLKVLLSGEEKVYKESWLKFVKRLVIGVVILILPVILSFIINLSGVLESYGVDKNNIFCIFS